MFEWSLSAIAARHVDMSTAHSHPRGGRSPRPRLLPTHRRFATTGRISLSSTLVAVPSAKFRDCSSICASAHPGISPLLLAYEPESTHVPQLLGQGLNNLIARHGGLTATQELVDEQELIVTCQKLLTQDIFGLEKYLATWGVCVHETNITSTDSKAQAMEELEAFLEHIDCHGTIIPAISLVADELLMNAIFNAPIEGGVRKYSTIDRSHPLVLGPAEQVRFRYACDGKYVAVSVSDNFGSLDREVVIRYLEQAFIGKRAQIEQKQGGAGIGLYLVFNSITQLVFNIEEDQQTEVIAMFYIRSGARTFRTSGRSLNLFFLR